MILAGAQLRGVPVSHMLLSGPAGHGKTSIAAVVAGEMGWSLTTITGMMLEHPLDLAGILMRVQPYTVVFIDEVHAASRAALEVLYQVLEDGRLSAITGSGSQTNAVTHQMPPWLCLAATTDPGKLSAPFRQRFGYHGVMGEYSPEDLGEIVRRSWDRKGVVYAPTEPTAIGHRAKGVPRLALHLANRVLDFVAIQEVPGVKPGMAAEALGVLGIDERGLDSVDRKIIWTLVQRFAGKLVGLDALAGALDMDPNTLKAEREPFLVRADLMARTSRGRMALPGAFDLVGCEA